MSPLVLIPAYQAERHLGRVLADLKQCARRDCAAFGLLVVDDGSTDATSDVARAAGIEVLRHRHNQGKGAALRSGFVWAQQQGYTQVVTADADGQHPAEEILKLVELDAVPEALILGVRDLVRDGAPRPNQFSNGISNWFLSRFTDMRLQDTQCGLRRYPVASILALGCKDDGYAFEAEVILRAARHGLPILQLPIRVRYADRTERISHFHSVRDPFRIVCRVVSTLLE